MEQWKPVLGYEGLYEASDQGNIRGLKTNKILRPGTSTCGYLYVSLSKQGKQLPKQVHRLVIEAFQGKMPPRIETNHKNGIKTDNRLENLEQSTRSQNQLHRIHVLGIKPIVCRGEDSGHARFTEKEILRIRSDYDEGFSYQEIADEFGCTKSAICHIVKRRSWTHI